MLLVMAVACAADDGTAPDAPDIPIVQAAESPYCTRDSQCAGDATCAPDGSHCVGEDPDAHPCPAPAGTCAASDDPSCVDTTNDSYNCGGCGIRCPWGTAGVIFCVDSVCYSASGH
jgi:hypothetical protein